MALRMSSPVFERERSRHGPWRTGDRFFFDRRATRA